MLNRFIPCLSPMNRARSTYTLYKNRYAIFCGISSRTHSGDLTSRRLLSNNKNTVSSCERSDYTTYFCFANALVGENIPTFARIRHTAAKFFISCSGYWRALILRKTIRHHFLYLIKKSLSWLLPSCT